MGCHSEGRNAPEESRFQTQEILRSLWSLRMTIIHSNSR